MSTTYTPVTSTYWPTITIPSATDGVSSTGVNTPLKQLADNEAIIKTRLDSLTASSSGTTAAMLPRVANDAALLAIVAANRVDGMVCYVDSVGLYEFLATDTTTPAAPFIRQPNDVSGVNPGRWKLSGIGALNIANGVPQLGATGIVEAARMRNGVANEEFALLASTQTLTGSGYQTVSGLSISIPSCAVGDVLRIEVVAFCTVGIAPPTGAAIQLVVTDGGSPVVHPESNFTWNAQTPQALPVFMRGYHTVVNAGTVTASVQMNPPATTCTVVVNSSMEVVRILNQA